MEQRLASLEDTVDELQEEVRFLRSELRNLRRERRGGEGSHSHQGDRESQASFGSVRDSRDSIDSRSGNPESAGSFSVVRAFNENASRSRSEELGAASGGRSPTLSSTSASRTGTVGSSRCALTWVQRESICDEIGAYILRSLEGGHRGPSGRDRIELPSRLWLVFRDYEGLEYRPVRVCRSFAECRDLVKRGSDCGDSVFVGLPSEREACRVTAAAGFTWPSGRD